MLDTNSSVIHCIECFHSTASVDCADWNEGAEISTHKRKLKRYLVYANANAHAHLMTTFSNSTAIATTAKIPQTQRRKTKCHACECLRALAATRLVVLYGLHKTVADEGVWSFDRPAGAGVYQHGVKVNLRVHAE